MTTLRLIWLVTLIFSTVTALPVAGAVYTWVDEKGYTHFADRINAANQKSAAMPVRADQSPGADEKKSIRKVSSRFEQSRRPPPVAQSRYLQVESSQFILKVEQLAMYKVIYKARDNLPDDALLVVRFENPSNKHEPFVDTVQRNDMGSVIRSESPLFPSLKCDNYAIEVEIYSDAKRSRLLELFIHTIQSPVDIEKPQTDAQWIAAILEGNCR
jgi:hypothetical protein